MLTVFAGTYQLGRVAAMSNSKAVIFQKLFPLKAHVYILKRDPEAPSQNQHSIMLWAIQPNVALSSPRSKQIQGGNAASNQQGQKCKGMDGKTIERTEGFREPSFVRTPILETNNYTYANNLWGHTTEMDVPNVDQRDPI